MEVTATNNNKTELLTAIGNSMADGRNVVNELNVFFMDCVNRLRIEQNQEILQSLTDAIANLQHFIEFAIELKNAISCFDDFGMPADPISSEGTGLNLFKELLSALENQDWVMLSDLVEYELSPLLSKEEEWMGVLQAKLEQENIGGPSEKNE